MKPSRRTVPRALFVCTLLAAALPSGAGETGRFEFESYVQIAELFERLDYTEAAWQAGIREVPRVFLTDIPPRWRDKTSKSVAVKVKKELFFRALAPLALRSNELIHGERTRLLSLNEAGAGAWSAADQAWLSALAFRYGVTDAEGEPVPPEALAELSALPGRSRPGGCWPRRSTGTPSAARRTSSRCTPSCASTG